MHLAEELQSQINQAGYGLLQSGNTSDAIKVLKLNVALFPSSANVYDSLGEVLAASGQRELAIKNYKKSLEMNPDNTNSAEQLAKLQAPVETSADRNE